MCSSDLYQLQQFRVFAEEVLSDVVAARDRVFLVLAVDHFPHAFDQQAGLVFLQERIPVGSPDHLDHIPSRSAEQRFQFLDNLAVAAHGAVESLQVAIDDEGQVVQLFAGGERNRAQRLGFVGLTVTEERPDARAVRVLDRKSTRLNSSH